MKRNESSFSSPAAATQAMALGAAIKAARIARQRTQADLAERARLSRRTLTRIEAGDASVAFGGWLAALEACGLLNLLDLVSNPQADSLGEARRSEKAAQRVRHSDTESYDF